MAIANEPFINYLLPVFVPDEPPLREEEPELPDELPEERELLPLLNVPESPEDRDSVLMVLPVELRPLEL